MDVFAGGFAFQAGKSVQQGKTGDKKHDRQESSEGQSGEEQDLPADRHRANLELNP
jgi:hypothetical protein